MFKYQSVLSQMIGFRGTATYVFYYLLFSPFSLYNFFAFHLSQSFSYRTV